MHADILHGEDGQVFVWNVDQAVGQLGANLEWDVLFVQWCFYKLSKWPRIDAASREIFAATGVGNGCTGKATDPLVVSIRHLQKTFRAGPIDGRVSPATKGHYAYKGETKTYLIFYLNAVLRVMHPEQYPRIDLMPEFVWRMKDIAMAPFL